MIAHKDFTSNCKRIAKYIMKQSGDSLSEQFEDMICYGNVVIDVSANLMDDFNAVGKAKYVKEINKNLKGCSVEYSECGYPQRYIKFNIEFDDDDPETEDW